MAVTLFFGIRLSGKPYERIAHKLDEVAYSTYKVENLKKLLADDLLGTQTPGPLGKVIFCKCFRGRQSTHYCLVLTRAKTKENIFDKLECCQQFVSHSIDPNK